MLGLDEETNRPMILPQLPTREEGKLLSCVLEHAAVYDPKVSQHM